MRHFNDLEELFFDMCFYPGESGKPRYRVFRRGARRSGHSASLRYLDAKEELERQLTNPNIDYAWAERTNPCKIPHRTYTEPTV